MTRIYEIDLPGLRRLDAAVRWFHLERVIGRGNQLVILVQFFATAFARRRDQITPELRPGPWPAQIMLARGMAIQPLVQLLPDDEGFLPVGGNVQGWETGGVDAAGLVCYAEHWDPTVVTLPWLAFQVARILVGEVLSQEAQPLSCAGRDFQATALQNGSLPTERLEMPCPELLTLRPAPLVQVENGIEFDE